MQSASGRSRSALSRVSTCLLMLVACTGVASQALADSLLDNGNFADWADGTPRGWSVQIGARNGNGPKSTLAKIDEVGLSLHGDDSTAQWQAVSQTISVEPEACYRLSFQARARDIRRVGRQFDNCYIRIVMKNERGENGPSAMSRITHSDWTSDTLVVFPGPAARTVEVMIFLSQSGTLDVRELALDKLLPNDSFRLLVEEMDRHYSYFAHKKIDWREVAGRFEARAGTAEDAAQFIPVVQELLTLLHDPHITIEAPDKRLVATEPRDIAPNYNFQYLARQLQGVEQIGKIGFVGRGDGFGYAAIGSLAGDEATFQKLEAAVSRLVDAPGLIIDLRGNQGGDERRAQRIVGLFTDQRRLYAKSQIRSGPKYTDLTPPHERFLEPRDSAKAYLRPIVCLLGPRCISSGEGMALMMQSLPHVTTMGQPTAGASGNPAPLPLPNGVTVNYSRWFSLTPAGDPIEGRGVLPAVVIEHDKTGDPTFDAAVKLLTK